MTDEQVKHMVGRFLSWRLPRDFHPDAGISFKPTFNDHLDPPMRHTPFGTNLFDYTQAEAMVRHMVEGLAIGPEITLRLGVDASALDRTIAMVAVIRSEIHRSLRETQRRNLG